MLTDTMPSRFGSFLGRSEVTPLHAGGEAAVPVRVNRQGPARSTNIDREVGSRIRERRVLLGITQQQLAETIGVTYQQAHKYETGANRVAVGRLFTIAEALGVGIDYFFPNQSGESLLRPSEDQRRLLDFVRIVMAIEDPRQQQIIAELAKLFADGERTAAKVLTEAA